MNGVAVGRYLQTYAKTDFGPRLGFAYDLRGSGRTLLRGGFGTFWNTPLTGTASSKGQNPPFLLAQALANPSPFVPSLSYSSSATDPPTAATGGDSRSSFDPNFRDGYAQQWSVNVQQQLGTNYMVEVGYVGSRSRQLVVLVDVNQAPVELGVTNPNINRPFFDINPTLGSVAQSQSRGTLDYHALQMRIVRRFSGGVSLQIVLHVRKGHRPLLRHRRERQVPQLVRPCVQPRTRRLRRHARLDVDLDLRAAVCARQCTRRLAGERRSSGAVRLPVHSVSEPGPPLDVHRRRGRRPAVSTGPHCVGKRGRSHGRSLVRHERLRADQQSQRRRSATPGAIFCAGPGSSRSMPH